MNGHADLSIVDEQLSRRFWEEHSHRATEEEMMLDSQAKLLGQHEIPEVLSYLPDVRGCQVLELGAGIGRFTGYLANHADHVTTVDFMESFISENTKRNGHHKNITFKVDDVMNLQFPSKSLDLVFSNWLFMYLTDKQVLTMLQRILGWLKPGGHLFFRESCFNQSGDKKRQLNPTYYRSVIQYQTLLRSAVCEKSSTYFKLKSCRPIQTYIKLKRNRNQLCWLLEKTDSHTSNSDQLQAFLDSQQYSEHSILRYERVFGHHFVSTGGRETTEEFLKMLNLKPGQSVLDVGSGIGGSAFMMAQKYEVKVSGIDLSVNMVSLAIERANNMTGIEVQFEIGDATTREYEANSFDVIYSRDTILHIKNKQQLFSSFLRWLRPGGRLLISDYCCSEAPHTDQFTQYVKQRGYILVSVPQYAHILEDVGFIHVKAEDRTQQFVNVLTTELTRTENDKDRFIQDFSEKDYNAIVSGWRSKLVRCAAGDQRWGLIQARKSE